ncbi:Pisatin demethylase [Cyphellophora attinorum]|uniref:Pisatin demethylase n=1 Tax=Cyphellophora attinorum TaxID=1664694 RepID=A0A0N0NHU2_9EURO|nr:Pisatin demethylase [Phialophora attinorum]KPI34669.1 Pisatin demethylase [Phialophora attinorum]
MTLHLFTLPALRSLDRHPYLNSLKWPIILVLASAVFYVSRIVYRIFLHPLSRFPGPRQAAISSSWLKKASKGGNVEGVIAQLHRHHKSAAIRIAPNELHIDDVDYYKVIYNQTAPFPKNKDFYDGFQTPHTVFAETDPALHKIRRKKLNPFFSKSAVNSLQGLIEEKLGNLTKRLNAFADGHTCNLSNAFRCLTADVISEYAFGSCLNLTLESDDQFYSGFLKAFDTLTRGLWDFIYSPLLRKISANTPRRLAEMSTALQPIFGLVAYAEASLSSLKKFSGRKTGAIFESLEGISHQEAVAEAMDFFAAGTDTTAYTLCVAVTELTKQPVIADKLSIELGSTVDGEDLPALTRLEQLPYLTACVKESLRFALATPGRLPRIVPPGVALVINGIAVPAGTVVGMSATTMHHNTRLWGDDAKVFRPERWLADEMLDQNMVAFSKGQRNCIGQNLAMAEITLVLARLFKDYRFEFAEGTALPPGPDKFVVDVGHPGLLMLVKRRA